MEAGPVAEFSRQSSPCTLQPKRFFVSWQGVLTLAYRYLLFGRLLYAALLSAWREACRACSGFPPPLVQLKRALGEAYGGQIPNENPGSRWPKTSLGCLKEGKRLTPDQLATLIKLCGYP